MIRTQLTHILLTGAMAVFVTGCTGQNASPETATDEHGEHAAHGSEDHAAHHDHPTTGPHKGGFVELGDHQYLAEVAHDEGAVTIYFYEHDGTTPVPIDAKQITINVMHDGKPEQFQLAAKPVSGDPEGQSSRFTLKSAELAGHLDEEAAKPKLMVTIDGTPFSAPLAHHHHEHDHEGHDHGEEGHDHAE